MGRHMDWPLHYINFLFRVNPLFCPKFLVAILACTKLYFLSFKHQIHLFVLKYVHFVLCCQYVMHLKIHTNETGCMVHSLFGTSYNQMTISSCDSLTLVLRWVIFWIFEALEKGHYDWMGAKSTVGPTTYSLSYIWSNVSKFLFLVPSDYILFHVWSCQFLNGNATWNICVAEEN